MPFTVSVNDVLASAAAAAAALLSCAHQSMSTASMHLYPSISLTAPTPPHPLTRFNPFPRRIAVYFLSSLILRLIYTDYLVLDLSDFFTKTTVMCTIRADSSFCLNTSG